MTNQLNSEAVPKPAADQNYLERWEFSVKEVDVGSCKNDWKCNQDACQTFNDASSMQCSGVGCQTQRPTHWKPCGKSFPLATQNVFMTVGDGGSYETVLQPSQECTGKFVPVSKQNQLQVSKHTDVEKMFGIKMLVVDTLDQTAGNYVCFHSQMFTNSTMAAALKNCEPVKNQPVIITYNAETLSTTPNNIQVRVVLVPTEEIPSSEIPVNTAYKHRLDELLDAVQKTNDALTQAYPGCIQLDNSEMAPSRSADLRKNKVNRPLEAHKRMDPRLVDELLSEAAKQDVKESIDNEGRVLRYGDALFELSIALLLKKRIELFVAGKNNTAVDCVAALQQEFPSDGSNARQFFKTIMCTVTEIFTSDNVYAFDQRTNLRGGRCAITGKETSELETTPDGENQRDACTPNGLRFIQRGRERYLKSISTCSTQVDDFNAAYKAIASRPHDCEDGSQILVQIMRTLAEVNANMNKAEPASSYLQQMGSKLTLALPNMLRSRQSMKQVSKDDVYQRCVGNIVNDITSNTDAYTMEERDDLRKGIRMLWMHMSEAFHDIDQISRPMTGLWFAGGASQTLQTTVRSNLDDNVVHDVISIANEGPKFQIQCAGCAGHAAPCVASVEFPLEERKMYDTAPQLGFQELGLCAMGQAMTQHKLENKELGFFTLYNQDNECVEPYETTADYRISKDDANANCTVKTTVFCENEADALQLQQEECIAQMLGQKDNDDTAGNYRLCSNSWAELLNDNAQQAGNGAHITQTPCVPEKQSMAFYVGILHEILYDKKTQQMAPGVTVDTANKLAENSLKNGNNDSQRICPAVGFFTGTDERLKTYAKVQKAWADTNDPGAVQARYDSMKIRGISVWKPLTMIGDARGIDPYSQNCVTLRIKGALTQEQCGGVLDVDNVMHKAAQLTVADHAENLSKVSGNKWGAVFLQPSMLQTVCIMKANAFPKKLHGMEPSASAPTISRKRVQGKRWNFLAHTVRAPSVDGAHPSSRCRKGY